MRQPDMDYDIGLSIHWSSSVWDIHKKTNRIFSYNSWRCGDRRRTLAANAPMPGSHKWGNDHEMNSLRPLPVLLCSSQPKKGKQSTVYVPLTQKLQNQKGTHPAHDPWSSPLQHMSCGPTRSCFIIGFSKKRVKEDTDSYLSEDPEGIQRLRGKRIVP